MSMSPALGSGLRSRAHRLKTALVPQTNAEVVTGGAHRRYLLHVPARYVPGTPTPLVIVIHGFMQTPAHQRDMSGWDEVAEREGFITAYPMGTGLPLRWESHLPIDESDDTRAQVEFIADLIDEICDQYSVDQRRIYASGMSNGGGLAYVLAFELSKRIAAIAGVAGLYTYQADPPPDARMVPMIAFHGVLDRIVPYEGGVKRFGHPVPAVEDCLAAYAARAGCLSHSQSRVSDAVICTTFTGCADAFELTYYTVADAGHSWPGGEPLPERIAGPTSSEINATGLTWEFFSRHPMPDHVN